MENHLKNIPHWEVFSSRAGKKKPDPWGVQVVPLQDIGCVISKQYVNLFEPHFYPVWTVEETNIYSHKCGERNEMKYIKSVL